MSRRNWIKASRSSSARGRVWFIAFIRSLPTRVFGEYRQARQTEGAAGEQVQGRCLGGIQGRRKPCGDQRGKTTEQRDAEAVADGGAQGPTIFWKGFHDQGEEGTRTDTARQYQNRYD